MTNRKILIVDDDSELREALVEQLALHEEFESIAVDNGTKGVQAAKAGQIDLDARLRPRRWRRATAYHRGISSRCCRRWCVTAFSKERADRVAATSLHARRAVSRPMIYCAPSARPSNWTARQSAILRCSRASGRYEPRESGYPSAPKSENRPT
jgi:hypothetical protein